MPALVVPAFLVTALVVTACTAGPGVSPPAGPPAPPPPPPPAACVLDTVALAAGTGVPWSVDAVTASDTRCVYDPASASTPDPRSGVRTDFVAVHLAAVDPATTLDELAAACAAGSREPVAPDGFVCRFRDGDGVLAARTRAGRLVTVTASAVPTGTTAERLAAAIGDQLRRPG